LSDSGGKKSGRRIGVMDECGLHDRAVFVFPGARFARDAAEITVALRGLETAGR
jgi:hypothetical protein